MPVISDAAVVLGRLDYSETSQILVLFTRGHGKVRAIAKGVKRSTKTRFAVGIDLLEIGQVSLSSRQERGEGLATLTEWKQTRSLSGLREKLWRIHAAQYAAEITMHLTEDWDPHEELFDVLVGALAELAECAEGLPALVRFQYELLEQIGSNPRFDACVLCGREGDLTHFSSFEGGVVCRHCEGRQVEKWEVGKETMGLLRAIGNDECGMVNTEWGNAETKGHEGTEARSHGGESHEAGAETSKRHIVEASKGGREARTRAILESAFGVLNYHISHLMGREPLLADRVVPKPARGRV